MESKRGQMPSYIIWMIIGAVVLVIGVTAYILLNGEGSHLIAYIKDKFTFGA